MKTTQQYTTGDYIVDTFDNIMVLGVENEVGFETDFTVANTTQNISIESIKRLCTEEEIKLYKEKYGRI